MIQQMPKSKSSGGNSPGRNRYPDVSLADVRRAADKLRHMAAQLDGIVKRAGSVGIDKFETVSGGARLEAAPKAIAEVIVELSGKIQRVELEGGLLN